MTAPLSIRKVATPAEFRAFFEFPWKLYRDDPNWTPQLVSMRRELLDKQKHPSWEYMDGEYFAAWRGDEIVGTIGAVINHRHNEFANERIGWFGMFEVYDDPEAAQGLLQAASDWVREQGYEAIRGPQSFTTHEECGLLVENFSPAVLLMPYNPPYYQKLIEGAGFEKAMDIISVYFDRQSVQDAGLNDRMERLVSRAKERSGFTVRPFDNSRRREEFAKFKQLYNEAWAENWSFVPMTDRELDALVASLGQFLDPNLAFFAEMNGEPAGFVLSIPDFNEVLRRVRPRPGVPEFVSLLRALWFWKIRPVIKGGRMPLLGVKKEFRNKGIELALMQASLQAALDGGYETMDCGWVLETNELLKITDKLGGNNYKRHRFYEKSV